MYYLHMIHDTFRPRFLGQTRLVAHPAMGTPIGRPEDVLKSLPPTPKNAKPPSTYCLFLGVSQPAASQLGQLFNEADIKTYMAASLNNNIEAAQEAGYEIVRTAAPDLMCPVVDPNRDPNIPTKLNEIPATQPCYEAGTQFVWACPRAEALVPTRDPKPEAPVTQALPLGPKPDLVPVAAGAGVVALLAAIVGGAFGGK